MEFDKYEKALEKWEAIKALVDSGKMMEEEFVFNTLAEDGSNTHSSMVVNDETRNGDGICHEVTDFSTRKLQN
ncbi:hypothetical protein PAAG_11096 [Paracoccidioides lutzii Pb01]|uniref:Uncharacterized protein n=1 Tax=Paracoccidioides lutzii (strain ATCC MYA-826 / Pb01) TaxID=502779 RepID=A0A0A2V3U2_PARBA|nr:hypothetical protein PAAG_11096 [Paracoccidioides lutzii Pb01]KGQ02143.1 hypothetical protein PAAG_11096 [Paracoccidioides lutzii Pb01]